MKMRPTACHCAVSILSRRSIPDGSRKATQGTNHAQEKPRQLRFVRPNMIDFRRGNKCSSRSATTEQAMKQALKKAAESRSLHFPRSGLRMSWVRCERCETDDANRDFVAGLICSFFPRVWTPQGIGGKISKGPGLCPTFPKGDYRGIRAWMISASCLSRISIFGFRIWRSDAQNLCRLISMTQGTNHTQENPRQLRFVSSIKKNKMTRKQWPFRNSPLTSWQPESRCI